MDSSQRKVVNTANGNVVGVLILLPERGFPQRSSIAEALLTGRTDVYVTISTEGMYETEFLFPDNGYVCSVSLRDVRVAMEETSIKSVWFWPNVWQEVSQHHSHIEITVAGGDSVEERALTMQRLLDTVLACEPSAIAVNYPSSGTLLPAPSVTPWLKHAGRIAIPLYVSCYFAKEAPDTFPEPGIFVSTTGLSDFGLMEIEGRGFIGRIDQLQEFIFGLVAHLFNQGSSIRDGDEVGNDLQGNVVVRIAESMFGGRQVYTLCFQ